MKRFLLIILLIFQCITFSQEVKSPYPIIFVHGLSDNNLSWSPTLSQLSNIWGAYPAENVFHAVLNAYGIVANFGNVTRLTGTDLFLGDNNDDVLFPSLSTTGNINNLINGNLFTVNFNNFWNQNLSSPQLILYSDNTPGNNQSTSNQSAIYKQGYALKKAIEAVINATGADKVVLVGHSMGGLAIREYLQRIENGVYKWWINPSNSDGHRVAKVITLGTPNLGSNFFEYISNSLIPNLSSEAVRDLRYQYLGLNGTYPAPYLFNSYENLISNYSSFYNYDVNCDGDEVDLITGLNEGNNGTIDNQSMSLPNNVFYTWITSTVPNLYLSDGVVDIDRQWLHQSASPYPNFNSDTILTHSYHSISLGTPYEMADYKAIIRGLDEPDNSDFAYKLNFDEKINALITFNTNYNPVDWDYYKVSVTETGILSVQIGGNYTGQKTLVLLDENQNIIRSEYISSFPYTLQQSVTQGEYFIAVKGYAVESYQLTPYSLLPSFVPTPVAVNTLEEGIVTPLSGYTTTNFNFTVVYKSTNGIAPDINSVKVHIINNTSYSMTGNGTNWQDGVTFSKSLNNFLVGSYQYYFSATVNGQSIRYPEGTQNLIFSVSQNSTGWDLRVTEITNSPSVVTPGQNFTATAKVHNNSNTPDKVYYNIPYEFVFYNSTGGIVLTKSGTISQVTQGQTININEPFTAPSVQGNCELVFNISVPIDENTNNNTLSKTVVVSNTGPLAQWFINANDAWISMNNSNPTHTIVNGTTYTLTLANNTSIQIKRGTANPLSINEYNFRSFDGGAEVVINENCSSQQAYVSFGLSNPNLVLFDQTNITTNPGTTIEFIANCNSYIFSATDPDIYLNDDGATVEPWAAGFTRLNNNHTIKFYFDIPSNTSIGTYDFYLASRLNNDDSKFLRKLSITIISAPPVISSLSKSNISADDTLLINGSNLGTSVGTVKFGNQSSTTIISWSNTQVKCIVPVGINNGSVVAVNTNGTSNGLPYTVISSTGNPIVLQHIPDFSINAGQSKFIANLNLTFSDPNGFPLTYLVNSQNNHLQILQDSLDDGILIVKGINGNVNSDILFVTAKDITNKTAIDTINVSLLNLPAPYNFHSIIPIGQPIQANLSWQHNSNNEQGFVIERKQGDTLSSNPYYVIGTVPQNTYNYIDASLSSAATYSYRVAAYNAFILSPYSNQDSINVPIPVEFESFSTSIELNKVILNWLTATETNNSGFEIQRKKQDSDNWEVLAFISGKGTTTEKTKYSYSDEFNNKVFQGKIYYRLKQIDFDGSYKFSNEINLEVSFVPKEYEMSQNYPNPFNPSTKIKYTLPFTSKVTVSIYNILGEKVRELVNDVQQTGYYDILFDASSCASGVYIYCIDAQSLQSTEHFSKTKKMILIK